MKKVTINLIISLGVAAGLLVATLALGVVLTVLSSEVGELGEEIETIFDDGEVDTVEGHGAIFEGSIFLLGALASAAIFAAVVLGGGYSLLLILFAVVARVLFAPQGGRLLAYRVLMSIEYVLQVIIAGICVSIALDATGTFMVVLWIAALAIVVGIVCSAVNTYSKRICT